MTIHITVIEFVSSEVYHIINRGCKFFLISAAPIDMKAKIYATK